MGAGVAAFALLTNTADAQVPAAPNKRIPSGSSKAGVELQAPLAFRGDKITRQNGLSKKPALISISRGGIFEYRRGTANPDNLNAAFKATNCRFRTYPEHPPLIRSFARQKGDCSLE